MPDTTYADRRAAGRELGGALRDLNLHDPVVLGLPRGGVPVAAEVADALGAELDVLVVRKVGAPGNPEFGVGAIGEGGVEVLDETTLQRLGLTRARLQDTIDEERRELQERVERYRGAAPAVDLAGRECVIVDDGLATGVSATAAVRVLKHRDPARTVLAVPVGAPASVDRLREEVDDVVALHTPSSFRAVGLYYRDFGQITHDEVRSILSDRPRVS